MERLVLFLTRFQTDLKVKKLTTQVRKNEAYVSRGPDDNKGRGYGLTKDTFHKARSANAQFPYRDDDEYDVSDDLVDDKTVKSVRDKTPIVYKLDPLAYKSVDPFYFAAGNTKLSDCFYRTDEVLKEVHALGDSMSPIPRLYKGKNKNNFSQPSVSFPSGVRSLKRTGTTRGYASSSPRLKIDDTPREEDEQIENLADLAAKQTKSSGTFSKRKDIFNP